MAPWAVTVSDFDAFVTATGHVTTAEVEGWSYVMQAHVPSDAPVRGHAAGTPWWLGIDGADWRAPFGPGSSADADHPVVHVSLYDALAYCGWHGVRLATEHEWEHAARGGLSGADFPWGDDESEIWLRANVWRGEFPESQPGFSNGTQRVDSFVPNGYGLYNMIGNVWEWTSSPWVTGGHAAVARGGSYLCHASYCRRYRVSARWRQLPDSTAGNLGFRVAGDLRS
jgi:formylglycine-generating enzyme required for sulfatase activity